MASFIDKIPQFNPYVQQLPVEAMVQVGMEKQKRYDEGVQRIQSQIDNIAGLPVIKDAHKKYLQSKVNELGNKLKTVASADFSNYQLVNSVGSMVNQIEKDQVIQDAVSSTARIRRGEEEKETARKAGKSSVENDAWWDNQVNEFLYNDDVKQRFNGRYVEYRDIDKKMREIADKIHETDNSIEVPYQRDARGNTLYFIKDPSTGKESVSIDPNSGGVPKVDDAILSIKTKGKPAEKLLSNFMTSLDENDQQQLRISSWYHYRGASPTALKNDVINNYSNTKKLTRQEIVNLNIELQTNNNLNTAEKNKIQARITDLNNTLSSNALEADRDRQLAELDTPAGLEQYKYKIYTTKTLNRLAQDLSYQSYQQEYKTNPYTQANLERQRIQATYDRMRMDNEHFLKNLEWKQTEFFMKQQTKSKKEGGGAAPIALPGSLPTKTDIPSILKLNGQIDDLDAQLNELDALYAPVLQGTKNMKDPNQVRAFMDGLMTKYKENPSFVDSQTDAEVKQYLNKRYGLETAKAQKQNLQNETLLKSSHFDKKIDEALSKETGAKLDDGTSFSAKDLYEFGEAIKRYVKVGYNVVVDAGDTGAPNVAARLNEEELMKEFSGTKTEKLARAYINKFNGKPISAGNRSVIEKALKLETEYSQNLSKIEEQKRNFQTDFLAKRMPERQTAEAMLSGANKVDIDLAKQVIGKKINEYLEKGVDVTKKEDFSPAALSEMLKDENTSFMIRKRYEGDADLVVTLDGKQQIVPMTSGEFSAYFPSYARTNPISDIKFTILSSVNKTTNLTGITDSSSAINAGLTGYHLPQIANTPLAGLVRVDVNGSAFNDGSSKDLYQVVMYVNDNGEWLMEKINPNYVNDAGLLEVLNNIGTKTVDDILKKHKRK